MQNYSRNQAKSDAIIQRCTKTFNEPNAHGTVYSCGCMYYHPVENHEINFALQMYEPCEEHKRRN